MVDKVGIMHITGPAVIKSVTGEDVTSEQIGGARAHNATSGCAHFFAASEAECYAQARKVMSYLPSNNMEEPPFMETGDDPSRTEAELREIVPTNPNKGYDVRDVIKKVVDNGDFCEVQELYAKNIVTGFARVGGRVIGIIANQAKFMAGCLDIDASDKASRHIRICDAFNIPIVTFEDVPGYSLTQPGDGRIICHGAKLLYAYSEATAPKITIVMRKAAADHTGMCSKDLCDVVLPAAGQIAVVAPRARRTSFRKEIDAAEDKVAKRAEKIEEYKESFANPYRAAQRGFVDRVILPEETRPALYQALLMTESKSELRPKRKHGILPN
ncbi:MAG: acyl-CoA carboxylase subunit beta [Cloacibacillus evryensis]